MALMGMTSADDEMAFLAMTPPDRDAALDKLLPVMAPTWPNLEKKHADMSRHGQHKH
jgi:hypothetical protein